VVERGSTGRNVYDTIASAVEVAEAGDVILVRPGIYTEPLVIDKPLEIIGVGVMGDSDRAVIRTYDATAVRYASGGGHGRIAAMTLEAGGPDACALDVTDGTLSLRSCAITGRGPITACVRVRGDAVAMIDNNHIADGEGVGILVCQRGSARITDNLIAGHAHSCIETRDGTQPYVYSNRIADSRSGGVWLHGHSRGEILHNDIYAHNMAGITVTDGADPSISGNRIHNGFDAGIYVGAGGRGTIKENDIYANDGTGIEIAEGGEPLVVNNRIYDGVGGGIALRSGGQGRIHHNLIRANQRAGVALAPGSNPSRFSRNTVIDGSAEGVYDAVGVDRADNQVFRNAGEDWIDGREDC
jgi:parallel beta-helix repeat protein